jgi:hypothetical protein
MESIRLRDAVQALRGEIMQAAEAASTQAVRFELGSIEMEFQVVVKREGGGNVKLGFHIFAADAAIGASGKIADERVQKVKIVLNPVLVDMEGRRTKLDISRDNNSAAASNKRQSSKHPLGR